MEKLVETIIISSSPLLFTEIDISMKVESIFHLMKEYLCIEDFAIAFKYNPKTLSSAFDGVNYSFFTDSEDIKKTLSGGYKDLDELKSILKEYPDYRIYPLSHNLEEIGAVVTRFDFDQPILLNYLSIIIQGDLIISKGIAKSVIFENIFNSFSEGVIILDKDDNLLLRNQRAEKLIQNNSGAFFDVGEKVFMETLKSGEDIINFSEIVLKRDYVPLTNYYGELEGKLYFLSDITEYTNYLNDNKRREKLALVGEMSAKLAHEIRNPLTAVRGFLELLFARKSLDDDDSPELMRVVMEEVDYINSIIEKLLDFSRDGKIDLEERNNINQVISDIIFIHKEELELRNIKIIREWSKEKPIVKLCRNELKHIFGNLMSNAIGSMIGSGELLIKTVIKKNMVDVIIRDTGYGISVEDMNKIFEPFFTTKERGTGLGMAIVKKAVELVRGLIEIKSTKGKGTEVKVSIPIINNRGNNDD